jgi:O-antigen ligase
MTGVSVDALGWRWIAFGVLLGALAALGVALVASAASPVFALVAAGGVVLAALMFLDPVFAVAALCASLPLERVGRLTDDADAVAISASRILGVLALASLLLHAALGKRKLHFDLPVWLYAGYVAIALAGNAWAHAPEDTYREGFRVLGNLLFLFLILNVVRDYPTAKRMVFVWLAASLLSAAYSLGDYVLSRGTAIAETEMGLQSSRSATTVMDFAESGALGTGVRRLFGTTAHPTLFGLNMAMTIPFLFWAYRSTARPWRLIWLGGLAIAGASVVLSNTRAVLIAAAFVAVFAAVRGLFRPNVFSWAALALCAVTAFYFVPEDVKRRTFDPSLYSTSRGEAIRVRFKLWEKSLDIVSENWLLGIGVGNRTALQERITDENTGYLSTQGLRASAHNEFIWVLAEVGIIGYVFFWSFVGYVTAAAFRAGAILRKARAPAEQYWFLIACQALLVMIPLFAAQSEAFHYPLKGWWLIAPVAYMMWRGARGQSAPAGLHTL